MQALANHAIENSAHLIDGVLIAIVVPPRELAHIAVEMLATHLVIHAVMPAFENGTFVYFPLRNRRPSRSGYASRPRTGETPLTLRKTE